MVSDRIWGGIHKKCLYLQDFLQRFNENFFFQSLHFWMNLFFTCSTSTQCSATCLDDGHWWQRHTATAIATTAIATTAITTAAATTSTTSKIIILLYPGFLRFSFLALTVAVLFSFLALTVAVLFSFLTLTVAVLFSFLTLTVAVLFVVFLRNVVESLVRASFLDSADYIHLNGYLHNIPLYGWFLR